MAAAFTAAATAAAQKTTGAPQTVQAAVAPQQAQAQAPLKQAPAAATSVLGKAQNLTSGAITTAQAHVPASVSSAAAGAANTAHGLLHTVADAAHVKIPGHDHAPPPAAAPASGAASKPDSDSPFTVSGGGHHEAHHDDKKHYHEWVANILVEKYAVKTSFFVHIFLGDFNPDPKQWGTDPNLVGSHVVFANNLTFTGCERCHHANEEHKLVTGTIPLTGALGDRLGKDSIAHLEPEKIIPYLKQNLHWRIQKHDDTPVERADIPSLKISVGHASVAAPQSLADFPTWGEITTTLGVTQGRLGGAGPE